MDKMPERPVCMLHEPILSQDCTLQSVTRFLPGGGQSQVLPADGLETAHSVQGNGRCTLALVQCHQHYIKLKINSWEYLTYGFALRFRHDTYTAITRTFQQRFTPSVSESGSDKHISLQRSLKQLTRTDTMCRQSVVSSHRPQLFHYCVDLQHCKLHIFTFLLQHFQEHRRRSRQIFII